MTPETAAGLFSLVKDFGLPLAMLGLFLWLFLTGKLVTGAALAAMTALYERERIDRIAAEAGLSKNSAASVDVAEAVREALIEMSKRERGIEPYADRLEGSARRAR
jgi:hypothetical protein